MTDEDYVREVERALNDLPWSQRRDLIADLRHHLAELPADTDLLARLGVPWRYASDLRTAEGLERRHGLRSYLRARRPRNLVLVILVAVVLALAIGFSIGAVVYVDSYQPLVYGDGTQLPLDSTPSSGAKGVTVVFRTGRPFLYGVTIRNNRHFAVKILGLPTSIEDYFKAGLFVSKPTNPAGDELPLERFHPFDLEPGETRWFVFKGVYACTAGSMSYGGAVVNDDIAVRYRFLWRTATTHIPLDEPLTIVFRKERCERPQRSAATR